MTDSEQQLRKAAAAAIVTGDDREALVRLRGLGFYMAREIVPKKEQERLVYYALADEVGRIKIGVSGNPWCRIHEMQTFSAVTLRLVALEPDGLAMERARHAQFATARLEREWFTFTGELRAHVEALRAGASQ